MKSWKIALAVIAVVAAGTMLACGGLVLLLVSVGGEDLMPEAELSAPAEVRAGDTLELVVTVSNPHAESVTLDSIDIDNPFLEGFQVVSVVPEPSGTDHIPFLDQSSWAFGSSLAPGEELTVTYRMEAIQAGHFSGNVDVCNPSQDYHSLHADILVRED